MKRYIVGGSIAALFILLLALFRPASEPKSEAFEPEKRSAESYKPLPIVKKEDINSTTEASNEVHSSAKIEKVEDSPFSSPSAAEDAADERKLTIEEMKELTYRKMEEEARKRGEEALQRFYERQEEKARIEAKIEERRKEMAAYREERSKWMKEMAKARKEGDVKKIMELERKRPTPPGSDRKDPTE